MGSPAEQFLQNLAEIDNDEIAVSPSSVLKSKGSVGAKIVAVVVFLILILIGTYFARVSGPAILGYVIGAMAFIIAPKIWKSGG